jgi:uncharacterized protein (TIGR02118 family)
MPVSMMAFYRRPDGGDDALETFRRRYLAEHVPLIRKVPGLRTLRVERIAHAYSETDLVMVVELIFDSRADLDAGMASNEMRAAGRNLREIAPGIATVVVLEPVSVTATTGGSAVLDALIEGTATDMAEPAPSDAAMDKAFGPADRPAATGASTAAGADDASGR